MRGKHPLAVNVPSQVPGHSGPARALVDRPHLEHDGHVLEQRQIAVAKGMDVVLGRWPPRAD
jgi:hypothetical protein